MGRDTWSALLAALIKGKSLTADETTWAMSRIMEGAATDGQIAGLAVALRIKGESTAEVAGLAQAMLDHATPIQVNGDLLDVVGTGGDQAATVNVSTMAAVVAAAAGATVAKHGNRAASSKCGSADVLEAAGVAIDLPPEASAELAETIGICYLFAPLYHPALRYAAGPRRELGVPTVFNVLGPLANPARPRALAVGVAEARMGGIIAGVLAGRGCSALVFHGGDGLDELTTATTSTIWLVRGSAVVTAELDPGELGLPRPGPGGLRGGDAAFNAAVMRDVLGGADGPVREIVLLNAAAALAASGSDGIPAAQDDLYTVVSGCLARATKAVDSGAAAALLDRWAIESQRLRPGKA